MDNINEKRKNITMFEDICVLKQYVRPEREANVYMAGISYCDKTYQIERSRYDRYVVEYVIGGEGTLEVDSHRYLLKEGDVFFLYKGKGHKYYCTGETWTKIWVVLQGEIVDALFHSYLRSHPAVLHGLAVEKYLRRILDTAKNGTKNYDEIADEILLNVHKVLMMAKNKKEEQPRLQPDLSAEIKDYIDKRLRQPLKLDAMATALHYSKNHLINVFRRAYGITPYAYYENQRMIAAAELLKNTVMTVNQISKEYGFENSQCFSKGFKKHFSLSPAQYRRK